MASPSARRRTGTALVLVAVALVAGPAGGCGRGESSPAADGGTAAAAGGVGCPVGRWNIPAEQEFVQVGLGTLTDGSVRATKGTIRVDFAADHTYTFTYDGVRLSLANGAGSAWVDGPVTGTWQLAGNVLTTAVGSSRIAVKVSVAGVTVTPSQSLNAALKNGLPGSAEVHCVGGRLVTTITAGAAAGRQVSFAAG